MKKIKINVSSFEDLIRGNFLYIDKTDFVWKLVEDKGTYFLSRPRRFGKSLLLSTFDAYFSGKKELFKGLKIEKLAPKKWDVYPVVRLELSKASNSKTAEELKTKLDEIVIENAKNYNITVSGIDAASKLNDLINQLYRQTGKFVVVLVDEYDKPILDNIFNDNIKDILEVIKAFYQVLKDQNGKEQFVFITGVTKFAHTSMFSGMNNPDDITMDAKFATMLGYTQKELEEYFAEYIPIASKANNMTEQELLKKLKEEYDGFRFNANSESIYNPVSVGNFFNKNEFANYWSSTGTPTFLFETAKRVKMDIEDRRNKYLEAFSFDKYDVTRLDPFVFAVQCGYLTIKDSKIIDGERCYLMDYPNNEVRKTFSQFLFTAYTGREDEIKNRETVREMRNAILENDTDTFFMYVKSLFAGIAWGNIGDKEDNPIKFYEGYFRNILSLTMTLLNVENEPEIRTSDGQVDLMCHSGDWRYLFELKAGYIKTEADKEKLLDKAMEQAKKREYHLKYLINSNHINIIALAFDLDKRNIVAKRINKIK